MKVADEGTQGYGAPQWLGMALWSRSALRCIVAVKVGRTCVPPTKSTICLHAKVTVWSKDFCPLESVASMR